MPPPARLNTGVLVLSAFATSQPQSFHLGRVAMRVAHSKKLMPVYPPAHCMSYMTDGEVVKEVRDITFWWYRRCARVWLCMDRDIDYPELDPLVHDILLTNEGLMCYPGGRHFTQKGRLPVYRFRMPSSDDNPADVELLDRQKISHYLSCNITSGLFRGLED